MVFFGQDNIREGYDVYATAVGIMAFPQGRLAYFCTGMEEDPLHECYEVIGSKGRIEVPDMFTGTLVKVTVGENEPRVQEFEDPNRFKVQIEHFSDCILNAKPVMFPPEDAKTNTAALVALKNAACLGRAIIV